MSDGQVVGTISIKVTPDTKHFRRELKAELEAIEKSMEGKVPVKADFDANGLKEKAKAAAEAAGTKVKVKTDFDSDGIRRGIAKLDRLGPDTNPGILRTVGSNIAQIGNDALGAAGNIRAFGIGLAGLVAIAGLVAPGLALISGLLVALPGIAAGVLAPIAALALGFQGIGKALENSGLMAEKLDKKGKPTGEKTVGPQLKKIMDEVGGVFERGLTPVFQQLTQTLLPALSPAIQSVAGGLTTVAQKFTDVITRGPGLASLQHIFSNIGDAIGRSAPGVARFTEGLLTLADKLTAKFPKLADSFNQMGDKFLTWVDKITTPNAAGVSQFDTAMHNLKATLSEIGGLVGDLFHWGWSNLGAGAGDKIKEFAQDLRHLVTDTLPALQTAFSTIADVVKPLAIALEPVGKALGFLNNLGALGPGGLIGGPILKKLGLFDTPSAKEEGVKAGQAAGQGMSEGLQQMLLGGNGVGGNTGAKNLQEALQSMLTSQPAATPPTLPGDPTALLGLPTPEQLASKYAGVAGQIQTTFQSIGPQVQAALAQVQPAIDGVKQGLTDTFNNIGPLLASGISSSVPMVIAEFGKIGTAITTEFAKVGPAVTAAFEPVKQSAVTALSEMVSTVRSKGQEIVGELQSWPGQFQAAVGDLSGTLVSSGVALGQGLANGINQGKGAAIAAAQQMAAEVKAAVDQALGIHSPSKVFHDIGTYTAQGFQEGLEGGLQGVLQRATSLATQISEAMKNGIVPAGLQQDLKKELDELKLQYDQLKVAKDAATSQQDKQAISEQMKQVQAIRDQLSLQSDQLGFTDKYGKGQQGITGQLGQQLTNMIDIGKNLGMANVQQFEQDLGISGQGAIPTIANLGIGYLSSTLSKLVSGAFGGQGGGQGGVTFNVGNMDDALTGWQNMRNKQALQYGGR